MRLERVLSAAAIVLIVGATVPVVASASVPTATIVTPTNGATILEGSIVRINYTGGHGSSVAGYVTLGDQTVATFVRPLPSGAGNATIPINVTIDVANVSSGAHVLQARVFTEYDDPVDTPPVQVILDKRPTLTVTSTHVDLDARVLHVGAFVEDDTGPARVVLAFATNGTNATFLGARDLSLPIHVGPGGYTATLSARDAHGQFTWIAVPFYVADREATLQVSHVAYELGGKVRLRGNVSDPEHAIGLAFETPLGGGSMGAPSNTTAWSAVVNVTPKLGTWNGTVRSTDAWGGTTETPFVFTIGGPNETFFERTIETGIGGYADTTQITLPRMLGGAITICVDGCSSGPGGGNVSGPAYDAVCENPHHIVCRQLTGRLGQPGAFDLCAGAPPPNNFLGGALWTVVRNVDQVSPYYGPCTSAFDFVNGTGIDRLLGLDHADSGVAVAATFSSNGTMVALRCSSVGGDHQCLFDAPQGGSLDISWLQGPGRDVSVRVNGIRV